MFDPFAPIRLLTNLGSPVQLALDFEKPTFGTQASVNVVATVTDKASGKPLPNLPLDILLNGQVIVSRLFTNGNGQVAISSKFTSSGAYNFEAIPSETEQFTAQFGAFVPSATQSLGVAALTISGVSACTSRLMDVMVNMNGASFKNGQTVLFPLVGGSTDVTYSLPLIAQGLFSIDPNQDTISLTGDQQIVNRYNAPGSIVGSLTFNPPFIPPGESTGTLALQVLDVCGNGFQVPLLVNGVLVQTDGNGRYSTTFNAAQPGNYSYSAVTNTPISKSSSITGILKYNAPSQVISSLTFNPSCLTPGQVSTGTLALQIPTIFGTTYPIPFHINGESAETDANGNYSTAFTASQAQTYSYNIKTDTPVSVSALFSQVLALCALAQTSAYTYAITPQSGTPSTTFTVGVYGFDPSQFNSFTVGLVQKTARYGVSQIATRIYSNGIEIDFQVVNPLYGTWSVDVLARSLGKFGSGFTLEFSDVTSGFSSNPPSLILFSGFVITVTPS